MPTVRTVIQTSYLARTLYQIRRMGPRQLTDHVGSVVRSGLHRAADRAGVNWPGLPRVRMPRGGAVASFDRLTGGLELAGVDLSERIASRWGVDDAQIQSILAEADGLVSGRIRLLDGGVAAFPDILAGDGVASSGDIEEAYTAQRCYFLIALALACVVTDDDRYLQAGARAIDYWIETHRRASGLGWEPMNVSERMVSWTLFAACVRERIENDQIGRWLESILAQGSVLADRPEYRSANNHLLFNARSLLLASLLGEPEKPGRFYKLAERILRRELPAQFGRDGVHLESSPGYHLYATQCLIECLRFLPSFTRAARLRLLLTETLTRALDVLGYLVPPGGRPAPIGDFKDRDVLQSAGDVMHAGKHLTGFDHPVGLPSPLTPNVVFWEGIGAGDGPLRTSPAAGPVYSFPSTGYLVWREPLTPRVSYLLFKAGPMSALPKNPGHGHADVLSFHYCFRGSPLFVDPGTYTYDRGEDRDYYRSSRSHNTLQLGEQDQALLWGAFRVAYTPRVDILSSGSLPEGGFLFAADMELKTPGPLRGTVHRRLIASPDGQMLLIRDRVHWPRARRTTLRLNVHSDWSVARAQNGLKMTSPGAAATATRLELRAFDTRMESSEPPTVTLGEGRFSPAYGVQVACPVVLVETAAPREDADILTVVGNPTIGSEAEWRLEVECAGPESEVTINTETENYVMTFKVPSLEGDF